MIQITSFTVQIYLLMVSSHSQYFKLHLYKSEKVKPIALSLVVIKLRCFEGISQLVKSVSW